MKNLYKKLGHYSILASALFFLNTGISSAKNDCGLPCQNNSLLFVLAKNPIFSAIAFIVIIIFIIIIVKLIRKNIKK